MKIIDLFSVDDDRNNIFAKDFTYTKLVDPKADLAVVCLWNVFSDVSDDQDELFVYDERISKRGFILLHVHFDLKLVICNMSHVMWTNFVLPFDHMMMENP